MSKKILMLLFLAAMPSMPVFALTSDAPLTKLEVVILPKEEIVKLSDEQLTDTYIDVVVEIDASRSFHTTSGYTPKQYGEYKNLLKYKFLLLMEIHNRNIDIPQLER